MGRSTAMSGLTSRQSGSLAPLLARVPWLLLSALAAAVRSENDAGHFSSLVAGVSDIVPAGSNALLLKLDAARVVGDFCSDDYASRCYIFCEGAPARLLSGI